MASLRKYSGYYEQERNRRRKKELMQTQILYKRTSSLRPLTEKTANQDVQVKIPGRSYCEQPPCPKSFLQLLCDDPYRALPEPTAFRDAEKEDELAFKAVEPPPTATAPRNLPHLPLQTACAPTGRKETLPLHCGGRRISSLGTR